MTLQEPRTVIVHLTVSEIGGGATERLEGITDILYGDGAVHFKQGDEVCLIVPTIRLLCIRIHPSAVQSGVSELSNRT